MSAFVMDEKFFDQLASELYAHATLRHSSLHWPITQFIRSKPDNRHEQALQEFTRSCYTANVIAVNQRYGEHHATVLDINFTKPSGLPKWSNEQLFKHLECLLYQMAEGDVPESAIYKELESLI